jgi:NAD(P)-dependent dehydrogenase (short-subunit alcohol dehydrogenase family)
LSAHLPETALIVGASRGLGLALAAEHLARGWHVVATQRAASPGLQTLAERAQGRLEIETLDINKRDEIVALRRRLDGRRIDLLFVNAGVSNGREKPIGDVTTEEFTEVMVTNALSPMRAIEELQALVPSTGVIGVMSSGLGSVADNENGAWETYRASKAALNTLMRSFAARHRDDPRGLVIIAPGWVRTDMGGPNAALGIEESIPNVADVLAAQRGKPGLRYLDYLGRTIRW